MYESRDIVKWKDRKIGVPMSKKKNALLLTTADNVKTDLSFLDLKKV